jgi:chemotaxis protein CheD
VSTLIVDIADLRVSNDPDATLVTYALGSCIALVAYDPTRRIGGLVHYMLPLATVSPEKAQVRPAMFADTGVPLLFRSLYELGCRKQDLIVKAAGGGALHDDNGIFNIGRRNYTVLRKMLWKNCVLLNAEDVGGTKSRTVRLHIGTGRCLVTSQGEEVEL